jgi:mitochondrial fission protein ELM1
MKKGAPILLLTDGKAGHENQSRALVRALGRDAEVRAIAFKSPFHKALSYLFDRLGILSLSLFKRPYPDFAGEKPSAVVGTGSGTFYAAKAIARLAGVRCAVVLYPRGYRLSGFDCILAPSFDRPAKAQNIIELPMNLVAADDEFYARSAAEFAKIHRQEKPAVAVIVGGPNKCADMTPEWMRRELERVFRENPGREFWVTTSRRTPPAVEAVVDSFPFDYKLIYSRDRFNPIPAFVAGAEKLYVSAESTGMISEACTFGSARVEVMDNLSAGRHKFRRFVESLSGGGYIGGSRKAELTAAFAAARERLGLG